VQHIGEPAGNSSAPGSCAIEILDDGDGGQHADGLRAPGTPARVIEVMKVLVAADADLGAGKQAQGMSGFARKCRG